ncbi:MAG: PilZ domain-containing protein [Syntrophobacteraceae bacterium]
MGKLPLEIDNEIHIRGAENKILTARSRILGGRHGDFILIEEPHLPVGDRLAASFDGNILCVFFYEGELYRFQSKVRRNLPDSLTLIDYPSTFDVETVRKHHRIQVNIETRIVLERVRETATGSIKDISEGGCSLVIPALLHVSKNIPCSLDFILPNNESIQELPGTIRSATLHKLKKTTDLGIQFTGTPEERAAIVSFCRFCMYFKV